MHDIEERRIGEHGEQLHEVALGELVLTDESERQHADGLEEDRRVEHVGDDLLDVLLGPWSRSPAWLQSTPPTGNGLNRPGFPEALGCTTSSCGWKEKVIASPFPGFNRQWRTDSRTKRLLHSWAAGIELRGRARRRTLT